MPSTDAVAAVVFKIGGNVVTAHDAMTVTATVVPASCLLSGDSSIDVAFGAGYFVSRYFSGFIGSCVLSFVGRFSISASVSHDLSLTFSRIVLGSSISLISGNCCGQIVHGIDEVFSGISHTIRIHMFIRLIP